MNCGKPVFFKSSGTWRLSVFHRLWGAAALLLTAFSLAAAETPVFTVVLPEQPTADEQAAASDLSMYLEKITGRKFPVGKAEMHRIFLRKAAPSVAGVALKARETRVKSENGDLYIWGEGPRGSVNAVYDCLEQVMGCRWYTPHLEKIPKNPGLDLFGIDYSRVPSFLAISLEGAWAATAAMPQMVRFYRRSRLNHTYFGDIPTIGPSGSHTPSQMIPTGVTDTGVGVTLQRGGLKYLKDKRYFITNPEFYSMNRKGKRTIHQLCYSNRNLRKELIKNMELVVKHEYKGGPAGISCGLNDNAGIRDSEFGFLLCACPGCRELARKYRHGAGPYFDFLIEVGEHFKKHYPEIVVSGLAYQLTEMPPVTVKSFPDNLHIHSAPLWKDFLKPIDHPSNRAMLTQLKAWKARAAHMDLQLYPTVYPQYNVGNFPLVANLRQLAGNMRAAHRIGIERLTGQIGFFFFNDVGFNDLRNYLLTQMARNVKLDENALIEDFMKNVYGSAAPLMIKYWRELEKCEAEEPNFMNWQPDQRARLGYLTPDNLTRWQRMFDEMVKLTADESAANAAVRRARMTLDEATLAVHYKFPADARPDVDAIEERWNVALGDAMDLLFSEKASGVRNWNAGFRRLAMDVYLRLARGPKPLPEDFRKKHAGKKIFQAIPNISVNFGRHLKSSLKGWQYDPEAAFGITFVRESKLGNKTLLPTAMAIRSHGSIVMESGWDTFFCEPFNRQKIAPETIRKAAPGYHLYYLGRMMLWPDCSLTLYRFIPGVRVSLGHIYDPKSPRALYDVYVSLKAMPKDRLALDRVVVVRLGKEFRGDVKFYVP